MKLTSRKIASFSGTARVPGDKSISHRALMLGGLAEGETIISGLLTGEDVLRTADSLRALGARIEQSDDGFWRCHGVGADGLQTPAHDLDMGNSGTSTRLLMGLIGGRGITATLTGDASLTKRPMKRVMTPLEMMGITFTAADGGRLPLTVHGTNAPKPIEYRLPVASAQVKSAILLAALAAKGKTTVIENTPTRDHTENMLRAFGAHVETKILSDGAHAITIEGPQNLTGCAIDVPSDPSSAAFLTVAALLTEGSEIKLPHICINERRAGLYATLKEMGADIEFRNRRSEGGEPIADLVIRGTGPLRGITVPPERAASMIDEFPVLAMAASCARGVTRMEGLAELRVKESDRLEMIAQGLRACGVAVETGEDWLAVHGAGKPPRGGAFIATALDHRIAMSFLVLGMTTDEPITIDDSAPINTSFPDFTTLMNDLGANITDTGT